MMMAEARILFDCYEAIAKVSGRMLDAARGDDWNGLLELQREYQRLVDMIRPLDSSTALDEHERARKHDLIRRILSDDAGIRDLASPRMARLSALLSSSRHTRALQNMYDLKPRF